MIPLKQGLRPNMTLWFLMRKYGVRKVIPLKQGLRLLVIHEYNELLTIVRKMIPLKQGLRYNLRIAINNRLIVNSVRKVIPLKQGHKKEVAHRKIVRNFFYANREIPHDIIPSSNDTAWTELRKKRRITLRNFSSDKREMTHDTIALSNDIA